MWNYSTPAKMHRLAINAVLTSNLTEIFWINMNQIDCMYTTRIRSATTNQTQSLHHYEKIRLILHRTVPDQHFNIKEHTIVYYKLLHIKYIMYKHIGPFPTLSHCLHWQKKKKKKCRNKKKVKLMSLWQFLLYTERNLDSHATKRNTGKQTCLNQFSTKYHNP